MISFNFVKNIITLFNFPTMCNKNNSSIKYVHIYLNIKHIVTRKMVVNEITSVNLVTELRANFDFITQK